MSTAADPSTIIDLLRHGLPEGGSRYRGNRIDDPLSDTGWAQMRAAVGDAAPWDRLVTSPLQRCHAFAVELGERHGLPLRVDDRLQEVGFGAWEGRTRDQVRASDPAGYRAFYADPVNNRPAGAEPLPAFFARVAGALDTVLHEQAGRHVLLVAHAGVIRAALAHALAMDPVTAYRIEVGNASLTRLRHQGGVFRVDFVNRAAL